MSKTPEYIITLKRPDGLLYLGPSRDGTMFNATDFDLAHRFKSRDLADARANYLREMAAQFGIDHNDIRVQPVPSQISREREKLQELVSGSCLSTALKDEIFDFLGDGKIAEAAAMIGGAAYMAQMLHSTGAGVAGTKHYANVAENLSVAAQKLLSLVKLDASGE